MAKHAKKKTGGPAYAAFVSILLAALLIPLIGMAWAPTTQTTENRELAEFPQLVTSEGFNVNFLPELGAYFEDHYAFRNNLVDANSRLQMALFGTSPIADVVAGKDGWLFYEGELEDYQGTNLLTDRGAQNIAYNLSMMQGYIESKGSSFVFTMAPNKSTLYPEYMPDNLISSDVHNWDLVKPYLNAYGVNYVDLGAVISSQDQVLYCKTDTHWNQTGARLGYQAIMAGLGLEFNDFANLVAQPSNTFVGDMERMLYPVSSQAEAEESFDSSLNWTFVEGSSVEDALVTTQGQGSGSLLMYRDSFTNKLMPFFATNFAIATFDKYVPYNLDEVDSLQPTAVVMERVERHFYDLGMNGAIMQAPQVGINVSFAKSRLDLGDSLLTIVDDGHYKRIRGVLPAEMEDCDAGPFIVLKGEEGSTAFAPFHVSDGESDYGYLAYIDQSYFKDVTTVQIVCVKGTEIDIVNQIEVK